MSWSSEEKVKAIQDVALRRYRSDSSDKMVRGATGAALAAGSLVTLYMLNAAKNEYAIVVPSDRYLLTWDALKADIQKVIDEQGGRPSDLVIDAPFDKKHTHDVLWLMKDNLDDFAALTKDLGLENTTLHFNNYGFAWGDSGMKFVQDIASATGMNVHASVDMRPEHDLLTYADHMWDEFMDEQDYRFSSLQSKLAVESYVDKDMPGQDVWIKHTPDGLVSSKEALVPPLAECCDGASVLLTGQEEFTEEETADILLQSMLRRITPVTSSADLRSKLETEQLEDIYVPWSEKETMDLLASRPSPLDDQVVSRELLSRVAEMKRDWSSQEIIDLIKGQMTPPELIKATSALFSYQSPPYTLEDIERMLLYTNGGWFGLDLNVEPGTFSHNDLYYMTATGEMPPWYYRIANYVEDVHGDDFWYNNSAEFRKLIDKIDTDSDKHVSEKEMSTWWDQVSSTVNY